MLSAPKTTIAEAQALHEDALFNPAAVFDSGDGFVYGRIREMDAPPHETAAAIERINGYKMVAYCDPLLGIWREYKP